MVVTTTDQPEGFQLGELKTLLTGNPDFYFCRYLYYIRWGE